METISQKIKRYYSHISNYQEGAPNTRYKSWEWCHQAFLDNKTDFSENNIEFLSLHLAFYLASWGMYRGSSDLLQRDFKVHKKAVSEILQPYYESLWNYAPTAENIKGTHDLLFDSNTGLYWKIKSYYKRCDDETKEHESSDTLITKILMGTFGCIPAFDRFLKAGIKCYQENHGRRKTCIGEYKLTQSIEKEGKSGATDSFKALAQFAIDNQNELIVKTDTGLYYPPMKCVDMYFWEIGYELIIDNI